MTRWKKGKYQRTRDQKRFVQAKNSPVHAIKRETITKREDSSLYALLVALGPTVGVAPTTFVFVVIVEVRLPADVLNSAKAARQ